ncbi:MAG: hypothetical protein QMB11_02770, partial [Nonlabens sp.]|uniref:hypothetical protein n=1 Tax=Nonlabens sp. TaxID=1888209 RepID=UPI0035A6F28F
TKRLVFYATLLLLGIGFTANTYGQLVGEGAVKANFGVDGDAYANFQGFSILFPPITVPPTASPGVDDWFANKQDDSLRVKMPYYTGSGLNVISQLSAGDLRTSVQGNNNFSFTKRQSRLPLTIVNGYLWLDAVYGRDTNSAQGNSDTSIFSSTSDKNSDNPSTWNLGSGSVPQKDDIIDVMAHLRGEDPKDPTPGDVRPFTTLWAFAAATLRSTDGSKHIDFEFFRTLVDEYQVGDLTFGNTGPQNQGGRTAFTFYTADDPLTPTVELPGEVNAAGCIVVSIDYENGGTNPDVRIRVWMEESVFNSINSLGERPFDVVPGTFEKGELTGNFGYGRITQKSGSTATDIFGRVNAEGSTLAPPWGTLEGEKATFFDEYQTFQHVEIGINLTAFGLDKKNINDPCANILGSLLVKTRSSAGGNSDSFTSELKDFAGPFPFGFTVKPEVNIAVNREINCRNLDATITASGILPPGSIVTFYGPASSDNGGLGPLIDAEEAAPDLNRLVTQGGVYAAVVSARGFTGCTATAYVTVLKDVTPPSCDISGLDNNFCPLSTGHMYSGPAGLAGYEWSIISGNADIVGLIDSQTVNVSAGNTCGVFVLQLITTGANGCVNTCTKTLNIVDVTPPVISTTDADGDLGCNPESIPTPTFTGEDNCDGVFTPSVSDGGKTLTSGDSTCMTYSQTWTATYTDACSNAAVPVSVTYTWKEDLVLPVISTTDADGDLGCNPES